MVKNPPANAGDTRDAVLLPGGGKWQPTTVFLPGESHGQRSLVGYSPRGCKESDTTDHVCMPSQKPEQRTQPHCSQIPESWKL